MKRNLLLALFLIVFSMSASSRNDRLQFPIAKAMTRALEENMIDSSVTYYWGQSKHPSGTHNYGQINTNKKTNAFNKTDEVACEWVFLSAIKSFHSKAKKIGANAVVKIKSNYQNQLYVSSTEYECGVGTFTAGVALTGVFIKR